MPSMVVLHTDTAESLLGVPRTTVERGTVEAGNATYSRSWSWPCGCRGDVICGTLIELRRCDRHEIAA